MIVGFFPIEDKKNRFISISQQCIEKTGNEIKEFNARNPRCIDDIDCVILNWYEQIVYGKNYIAVLARFWIRRRAIKRCKERGIKVVFVFHNKGQHDVKDFIKQRIAYMFRKWLINESDRIIVLSDDTKKYLEKYLEKKEIEKKCYLIPHPNYIDIDQKTEYNKPPNEFVLLFIGSVRPYKNIELLIDVVKEIEEIPVYLKIVGAPLEDSYCKSLIKRINHSKKISYDFSYVPEESIGYVIRSAAIVVLPYDIDTSMNSGTVMQCFSCMRSVICPLISTLTDFDMSLYYSYKYCDYNDHKDKLKKAIKSAYYDWKSNKDEFYNKGLQLFSIVKDKNSAERISELYKGLFEELCHN